MPHVYSFRNNIKRRIAPKYFDLKCFIYRYHLAEFYLDEKIVLCKKVFLYGQNSHKLHGRK